MSDKPKPDPSSLSGTTLRVYRYLYRKGKPSGIREIQRELSLSSTSVAEYHVNKLLSMGLAKETLDSMYFVDAIVFENMLRIRRSLIPVQIGYLAFFATSLGILLVILRPAIITNDYIFGIIIASVGCAIFAYQVIKTSMNSSV